VIVLNWIDITTSYVSDKAMTGKGRINP